MTAQQAAPYRYLVPATWLLVLLLLFWGLGDIPLLSYNEARRALPTAAMFQSGDWLLPRLDGALYLAKPPLFYWLAAIAAHLVGSVSEWAMRLPSAFAALLTAVLAFRFARRHFGLLAALFTLQLLLANAGFALFARRAEIEMLLSTLCFASLLAALHFVYEAGKRVWLWLSYALLGLAVLTKGPLALIFVTLPLLVLAICRPHPRLWLALRDPWGWLVFLVVGSAWFVAVSYRLGPQIWLSTIHHDMVNKMYGHTGEPVYSYLLWLLADFFPAGLLMLAWPLTRWRRWREQRGMAERIALAVLVPFLLYTAFSDKHAKYLLPLYPWIAILLGEQLAQLCAAAKRWQRLTLLTASLVMLAGYSAYYAFAERQVFHYRYSALQQFQAWKSTQGNVPLYGFGHLDERLVFYAGQDIPILDVAALRRLQAAHAPAFVLHEHGPAQENLGLDCQVREFQPYLNRKKILTIHGLGAACQPLPDHPS